MCAKSDYVYLCVRVCVRVCLLVRVRVCVRVNMWEITAALQLMMLASTKSTTALLIKKKKKNLTLVYICKNVTIDYMVTWLDDDR